MLLQNFPLIDTSDYYEFGTDPEKAIQILDEMGYTPLGFADEPDNRFGYGLYLNETQINNQNQTKGHHFKMLTQSTARWSILRAMMIQIDLRQIRIYMDVDLMEFDLFYPFIYADIGFSYNVTTPQPDVNFKGPTYNFFIGVGFFMFGFPMEVASTDLWNMGFIQWLLGGDNAGWYNENYEISIKKFMGGSRRRNLGDYTYRYA